MSTIWTFDCIENKYDVYRAKDYMKKFRESLRENAIKIINLEKEKEIPLTNKQQEQYEKPNICIIRKIKFEKKYTNDKNHRKVKDHCQYTGK